MWAQSHCEASFWMFHSFLMNDYFSSTVTCAVTNLPRRGGLPWAPSSRKYSRSPHLLNNATLEPCFQMCAMKHRGTVSQPKRRVLGDGRGRDLYGCDLLLSSFHPCSPSGLCGVNEREVAGLWAFHTSPDGLVGK